MPPAQRKTTLHGVEVQQTNLQGKWYTPVDARVKIAEHADPALIRRADAGYSVVAVQFVQIADRWAYHCLVEYPVGSGIVTPGTDFIDTKDPSGVAKAETSAIGRALGLHGIAIEESIASADEMSRVADATDDAPARATATPAAPERSQQPQQTTRQQRQPAPAQRDAGRPTAAPDGEGETIVPPTEQQAKAITRLCGQLQRPTPVFRTFTEASRLITELQSEMRDAAHGRDLAEAFPAGQRGA